MDAELLAALPDNRILINTSRGAVMDNKALLRALEMGKKMKLVLDVWEQEPGLLLPLLARADIGTPHIAGYTLEGKAGGPAAVFTAFSEYLGQPQRAKLETLLPKGGFSAVHFDGRLDESKLKRLINLLYDVRCDDIALRRIAATAGGFDRLRHYYQDRREWSSLCVHCSEQAGNQRASR